MRTYTIFCPQCDELIMDAETCSCGWARPADTAGVGQPVGEPLATDLQVQPGNNAVLAGDSLWFVGYEEIGSRAQGVSLVRVDLSARTVHRRPLGEDMLAFQLATDRQLVFVSPQSASLPRPLPLLALDGQSGEEVWRFEREGMVLSAPACDGTRVAVTGLRNVGGRDTCRAWLLEAAGGEVIGEWELPVGTVRVPPGLSRTHILLAGGRHLHVPGPLFARALVAGGKDWSQERESPFLTLPVSDGEVVYAPAGPALYAFRLAGGEPFWPEPYRPPRKTSRGALTAPPVVAGDLLLAPCGDLFDDTPHGYALHALDRETGTLRWRHRAGRYIMASPVVAGDTLFAGDVQGNFWALQRDDGAVLWEANLEDALCASPIMFGDLLYLVTAQGTVHALRWQARATPPAERPDVYERLGDWRTAGVAHALSGDLSAAGRCFLRAGDEKHACKLFAAAGDKEGLAQVNESLGRWEQVIDHYKGQGDREGEAHALARAGRPAEAAALFEELAAGTDEGEKARSLWRQAGAAWETAGDLERAAAGYEQAGAVEEALRLWQQLGRREHVVGLLEKAGRWEEAGRAYEAQGDRQAAIRCYVQGGFDTLAEDCLQQGVEMCKESREDCEAAQLCETWAAAMIERLGHAAIGREKIARRLEEAARHYVMAEIQEEASRCRDEAARIMETPRFRLRAETVGGSGLVVDQLAAVSVELTNTGYGPAREVRVQIKGDIKEPFPDEVFAEVYRGETRPWETRIIPKMPGDMQIELHLAYKSYRLEKPATTRISQIIPNVRRPRPWDRLTGADASTVQFHIEKIIEAGATSNELSVTDSAVVSRAPLISGDAYEPPTGVQGRTPPVVLKSEGSLVRDRPEAAGKPEEPAPVRYCPNCAAELPAEAVGHCPECGVRLCPQCRSRIPEGARFCTMCGMQQEGSA